MRTRAGDFPGHTPREEAEQKNPASPSSRAQWEGAQWGGGHAGSAPWEHRQEEEGCRADRKDAERTGRAGARAPGSARRVRASPHSADRLRSRFCSLKLSALIQMKWRKPLRLNHVLRIHTLKS